MQEIAAVYHAKLLVEAGESEICARVLSVALDVKSGEEIAARVPSSRADLGNLADEAGYGTRA
jgi:hypothetical protein